VITLSVRVFGHSVRVFHRRDPLWARLAVVFGVVLVLLSGVALVGGRAVLARWTSSVGSDQLLDPDARQSNRGPIRPGQPINILLVGIDPRDDSTEPPRSDSIIILHVPPTHDRAYLISVPRDLLVDIPGGRGGGTGGGKDKINAAFARGAEQGGGVRGGFALLSQTLTNLVGVRFDAAGIVDFNGFRAVVDALGSVDMCIDERVESHHVGRDADGTTRPLSEGGVPVVYEPGCRHLRPWEALDYVRQRYGLPNGDYDRQRHQQQFLKALLKQATSRGVLTDPRKLDEVVRAGGQAVTIDTGGIELVDWAWTMHGINRDDLVLVRTDGASIIDGSEYRGEELKPAGQQLLAAVKDNAVSQFVAAHPEFVSRDK